MAGTVRRVLSHFLLMARGSTYRSPDEAAGGLLRRLRHEGYLIIPVSTDDRPAVALALDAARDAADAHIRAITKCEMLSGALSRVCTTAQRRLTAEKLDAARREMDATQAAYEAAFFAPAEPDAPAAAEPAPAPRHAVVSDPWDGFPPNPDDFGAHWLADAWPNRWPTAVLYTWDRWLWKSRSGEELSPKDILRRGMRYLCADPAQPPTSTGADHG